MVAALEVLVSGREASIVDLYGSVWAAAQWKSAFVVVSFHFQRHNPMAAAVSDQSSLKRRLNYLYESTYSFRSPIRVWPMIVELC